MKRIKILVIPSDTAGVGYFRSRNPHTAMGLLYYANFDIDIDFNAPRAMDINYYGKYDLIHFHKILDNEAILVKWLRDNGKVVICDVDDYWDLGKYHPMSITAKQEKWGESIINNLKAANYVTTTTELFKEKILPYNKNVYVIPNSIDIHDKMFQPHPTESKRLRFGIICGSSHLEDIKFLQGIIASLPPKYQEKIQIVLCGFDVRGNRTTVNTDTGIKKVEPIKPEESVWYTYENILTSNNKVLSPEYSQWLKDTIGGKPESQYENVENEPYRREWSLPIEHYAELYNLVDILLVPLKACPFNYVKSQLKVIECGFMGKPIIASDYGPYTIDLISIFGKKNELNENGNGILINNNKGIKEWTNAIKFFVDNPDWIEKCKNNLYNTVNGKYDIDSAATLRGNIYLEILQREGFDFSK